MFEKIVIADRTQIALRIARTCERMGIATVAFGGEKGATDGRDRPGAGAAVAEQDEPGNAPVDVAALIELAKQSGADAVHPGSGAAAEDPVLARAAVDAGLVFVGPAVELVEILSDRQRSRALAVDAGIRALPLERVDLQDLAAVLQRAQEIGYPVEVSLHIGRIESATRLVREEEQLALAIDDLRTVSGPQARPTQVEIRKSVDRARRVGVCIAADRAGNLVVFGEVEHSLGQDGRVLIEESPSPVWIGVASREQRVEMLRGAALEMGREGRLLGLGTVLFALDAEGGFHFERFVSGLPLGHSVTELCTGLDLVELQLRLAAGERMPPEALRGQPSGHAMEARLFAVGRGEGETGSALLSELRWPSLPSSKLRLETDLAAGIAVRTGGRFPAARIAAYGATRHRALLALDRALAETVIKPLRTNLVFLRKSLADDSFRAGQYDETFADRIAKG